MDLISDGLITVIKETVERNYTARRVASNWLTQAEKHLSDGGPINGYPRGINKLTESFDDLYAAEVANVDAEEVYSEEYWKNYEGPRVRAWILRGAISNAKRMLQSGEFPVTLQYIIKNWK
jgi:hypothetical protein